MRVNFYEYGHKEKKIKEFGQLMKLIRKSYLKTRTVKFEKMKKSKNEGQVDLYFRDEPCEMGWISLKFKGVNVNVLDNSKIKWSEILGKENTVETLLGIFAVLSVKEITLIIK